MFCKANSTFFEHYIIMWYKTNILDVILIMQDRRKSEYDLDITTFTETTLLIIDCVL